MYATEYRCRRSPASATSMQLLVATFTVLLPIFLASAITPDPETQILNNVYENWAFPYQLSSWSAVSGITACNMTGITCDSQHKVVSLDLYNIPTGIFDPLLLKLTSLSSVALVHVGLIGFVPPQISCLTGLKVLKISNNYLTGILPPALSSLLDLAVLELNSNQITGTIPAQLSTLSSLGHLQLGNNGIEGPLPASLSTLTSLVNFYAPFNNLTGPIPSQYSALQNLKMLSLSSNRLVSTIPLELTCIQNLSLSVNHNPAMCGSPLIFGPQARTGIPQACFDPHHWTPAQIAGEVFFWLVEGLLISFLITILICVIVGCIQEKWQETAAATAAVLPVAFVLPQPLGLFPLQPPPPVHSNSADHQSQELSRFFKPE